MKALVTGGSGFLGRYIVEKLVARGDEVVTLSRREFPDAKRLGVLTIQADIRDANAVGVALKGVDAVFHTAAKVGVWGPWKEFYDINVTGTRNVIDGLAQHGGGRLVYTSSPSVVFDGLPQEGIDETYPYPVDYLAHYPRSKAMAEREVLDANGTRGLLTCSLRPHLVWGPRDTNLVPRLVNRAKSGRLVMVGQGDNLVDTVYVENAADAHLMAVDRLTENSPLPGAACFISQGAPVNCWEWINEILSGLGLQPARRKISFKTAYRAGAVMEFFYRTFNIRSEPPMTRFMAQQLAMPHYFNIDKARELLGYRPAISMDEGLRRMIESYRKNVD